MSRTFTVTIGKKEYTITKASDGTVSIGDEKIGYHLDALSDGMYILWIDGVPYRISRQEFDAAELQRKLRINGRVIELSVEDERDALMSKFESSTATKTQSAVIKAPMPGKIARILVTEGELIEAGQGVVILEAMKMENELKATAAGIVKKIHAQEHAAVDKNAALIEIE